MLVGRRAERQRIDGLLDELRQRRGGRIALVGEAGIGKSELLAYAVAEAADIAAATNLTVLRAAGHAVATQLAFSVLSELTAPLLHPGEDWADSLPPLQRDALLAALALRPPGNHDRFAVYAGLSSLLAAVADTGRLLLVIDDWHQVDAASTDALLFALSRLSDDAVAALVAVTSSDSAGASGLHGLDGWPRAVVSGLDSDAIGDLVSQLRDRHAPPLVVDSLRRATGGNPLVLTEVVGTLSDAQHDGTDPLPSPLPMGGAPLRIYGPRIEALSPAARQALLVLSLGDREETEFMAAALATLGVSAEGLAELEDSGLLRAEANQMELAHPLLRLAVLDATPMALQRAAHRALADAMSAPHMAVRRAWHLADSVVGSDEQAAAALDVAAGRSAAISGYAVAARAHERAADLGTGGLKRAKRLLAAANAMQLAGEPDAAARLLAAAVLATDDRRTRAIADHERGRIALFAGRPHVASQLMHQAATRLEPADAAGASALMDAALAEFLSGRESAAITTAGEAIERSAAAGDSSGYVAELLVVSALLHEGDVRAALARFDALPEPETVPDTEYVVLGCLLLVWVGQPAAAAELLANVAADLRHDNALGLLPLTLYASAYATALHGDLRTALPIAHEGRDLAVATGNALWQYLCAGCLALILAHRGDEQASRTMAAEATRLHQSMDLFYPRDADEALAALELAAGNPERAVLALDPLAAREHNVSGRALDWITGPDLVEAHVRSGTLPTAHRLDELTTLSRDSDHPAFAASAHRSLGLCRDDDAVEHFELAAALYDRAGLRMGWARAQLLLGSLLRRRGQRTAARSDLYDSSEAFSRMGAQLWARRADDELRASGERIPRAGHAPADALTPSEQRVATLVAGGATNRQTATALFLSPKTVEMHLSRVYRKLGLRSRSELIRSYLQPLNGR